MVEIKYREYTEEAELAGLTVAEARKQFRSELGIPEKAQARLNGKKLDRDLEAETKLGDADSLTFARGGFKSAYLLAAMLTALAVTGGVFAYGYTTASTSLDVTASGADFAGVSANTSSLPSWTPHGFFKGTVTGGPIFDIDTNSSGYDGDMVVTVSIANADELVSVYRVLALKIGAINGVGAGIDVNGDGEAYDADKDYALLTLSNGAVDLYMGGAADNYTVLVLSGFYVSHITGGGWNTGYENPLLYAEVAQR
ncbi:MAG: hypothetical protein ABID87_02090 [Chloroflexota bacterium]